MTVYPGAIDQFRVHNNLPGMNYDAEKADIIYAEDINKISDNIVAIETTLGINPQGAENDIATLITTLQQQIAAQQTIIAALPVTIRDAAHPIGSYFETSKQAFNPATSFGGTWQDVTDITITKVKQGTFTLGTGGYKEIAIGFVTKHFKTNWLPAGSTISGSSFQGAWTEGGSQFVTGMHNTTRGTTTAYCYGLSTNGSTWHTQGTVASVSYNALVINTTTYNGDLTFAYTAYGNAGKVWKRTA